MHRILTIILPLASDMDGAGTVIFQEIRKQVTGQGSGIHHICLGLCALFCIISIAKIVADIMQDKEGGFGNVPLGKIFRPLIIMGLLVGYTEVIGLVGDGAALLGGGVEAIFHKPEGSTEKLGNKYDEEREKYLNEREGDRPDLEKAKGIEKLTTWLEREGYDLETKWGARWHGFMGFCYELPGFIAEWAFAIIYFIMMCFAEIQLTAMALYGQIALAFSVLSPWRQSFTSFLGKYITVCLWRPILALIAGVAGSVTPAIGGVFTSGGGDFLSNLAAAIMGSVVYLAAIHMAFNVGQIANDVFNIGSAGGAIGSGASAVGKKLHML